MEIYKKLAKVKAKIGKISKDSTNPFFKSKYFDVNALLEHVEPLLEEQNLLLIQPVSEGNVYSIIYDIETTKEENSHIKSYLKLPELNDPQKVGSAITYYRRYTLQSLLGLQAEDDDGNKASGNTNNTKENKREIKTWLTQDQFNAAMKSDKKGITATISTFTSGDKGMKKDYLTKLTEQLKNVS